MNWKYKIAFVFIGYLALTALINLNAASFMYIPPPSSYHSSENVIHLRAADGAKIAANYYPNDKAEYTILYCHGNATDIGLIKRMMEYFQQHGFAVFALDYHGYGLSDGRPSEYATYLDVEAAYDYLVNNLHKKPTQIIVYGKSLGAAVAMHLAIHRHVAGLVMESPFLSAYRTYTQIPIFLLDKYRNDSKIDQLSVPLFVIHGVKDRVIPFWQGKKLYEHARVPKQKLWVSGAGHNNVIILANQKYWDAWQDFLSLISK